MTRTGSVMPSHRVGEPVTVDAGHEADPRVGRLMAVARGVEQDPGLGLAERGTKVPAGPGAGRVGVQRHLAGRRQQLDQDAGDGPVTAGEPRADHLLGQGRDDLAERDRADAGQVDRAHALGTAVRVVVPGPGA